MAEALRVFLSYSHDSDEHAERVLALADALCNRGIDVILDRYVHPAPAEGWPRWMDRNLDEAQFVLMVCTETYRRRVMDREEPGKGLGVRWEGGLIYNRIYHDQPSESRFIPVLLPGSEPAHIPNPVLGYTYYRVATFDLNDPGFEALYRHLTDQPATPRPDLGALTILPLRPRPRPSPGPQSPSGGPMINIEGVATPPRIVPRKLFISYAHGDPDQTLAQALSDGLRRAGHEVFIDTAISLGADWGSMNTEKVMASDFLVLLLSARSVHSEMVPRRPGSHTRGTRPRGCPGSSRSGSLTPGRSATPWGRGSTPTSGRLGSAGRHGARPPADPRRDHGPSRGPRVRRVAAGRAGPHGRLPPSRADGRPLRLTHRGVRSRRTTPSTSSARPTAQSSRPPIASKKPLLSRPPGRWARAASSGVTWLSAAEREEDRPDRSVAVC